MEWLEYHFPQDRFVPQIKHQRLHVTAILLIKALTQSTRDVPLKLVAYKSTKLFQKIFILRKLIGLHRSQRSD